MVFKWIKVGNLVFRVIHAAYLYVSEPDNHKLNFWKQPSHPNKKRKELINFDGEVEAKERGYYVPDEPKAIFESLTTENTGSVSSANTYRYHHVFSPNRKKNG